MFKEHMEDLKKKKLVRPHNGSMAISGNQIVHFLYYCYRIRGGNVKCHSTALSLLVSSGFAIVEDYKLGKKGTGAIVEPLVHQFLSSMVRTPDAFAWCDRFIAEMISSAQGNSHGNTAEYAIANCIINAHKQSL